MRKQLKRGYYLRQLCKFSVLFLAFSMAKAEPLVAGNTINTELYSWYQVQRVDDLHDAVEGFRQFIVEPGVYNVINLHSRERFEGVEVTHNNAERLRRLRDSDIRIEVYSTTAMEVFWDRVPFPGIRYEVYNPSINLDEPVIITDANSYYADGLRPGSAHGWSIVAVTDHNERIRLKYVRASTIIPVTEPDAPSEVSVSVYSATAAELFWTLAKPTPSSGALIAKEIRRNGDLLATLGSKYPTSYYDDMREPGVSYLYEVTAVFRNGPRKTTGILAAAWVDPVTDPTPSTSDEIPSDLQSALFQIESLITLKPLRDIEAIARELITVIPQENELISERNIDDEMVATYQCADDALLILRYTDEQVLPRSATVDGEGYCTIGYRQIKGSFYFLFTSTHDTDSLNRYFSMYGVEIRDSLSSSTIQVDSARLETLNTRPNIESGSIYGYVRSDGIQSLTVTRLFTSLEDEDRFGNPIELNRAITANGISGSGLENGSLQILNRFSGFIDGRPTEGVLLVNKNAGGSSFRIDADSGDDSRYVVSGDENGSAFGFLVPWSEGFSF